MNLSPRQREVLEFLAAGHAPVRCESVLGIRYGTFKEHLAKAYLKLGARNDAHAVAIAMRQGLIN